VNEVADAFWRAAAYCLHPKVILGSLLPLVAAGGVAFGLGWFFWTDAVDAVRATIEDWSLVAALHRWLDLLGAERAHALLAPILVVAVAVPGVLLLTLLLVAALTTPVIVSLVAARRFPALERRRGARWWHGVAWSIACTAAAGIALVVSMPLWFVPPLVLVLPPLIWGWLTYRVYAFDVLADHASADERRLLLHTRRWPLLAMGVACGTLGAAPSLLWTLSVMTFALAPLLVLVSIWLYTLVFAFAGCWFAHYALAALDRLRRETAPPPAPGLVPSL
jgi:hypothetical protein